MLFQVILAAHDGLAPEALSVDSIAAFEGQVGQVAEAMAGRLAASGPTSFELFVHLQRAPVLRIGFVPILIGWIDLPSKCEGFVRRGKFLLEGRWRGIAGNDWLQKIDASLEGL